MLRTILLPFLIALTMHSTAQFVVARTVHFATGSISLSADEMNSLRSLCPDPAHTLTVAITGHSDDRGDAAINRKLSFQRAENVRESLHRTCPNVIVTTVTGSGSDDPVADNGSADGRAMNRRVEITMGSENVRSASVHSAALGHSHVQALIPTMDKVREMHRVNASDEISVRMADGTLVRIPARSIIDAKGDPVHGEIDLSYRSFHEPYEVIASGIPMHFGTGADMGHFETAGMYEIYTYRDGEKLELREDASITLVPPAGPALEEGYTTYALNEATGEWQNSGSMQNATITSAEVTNAVRKYMDALMRIPSPPDSLTFLERQDSPFYCYTRACLPTSKPYAMDKGKIVSPYRYSDIPSITLTPLRSVYNDRARVAFTVQANDRALPEWRAFPRNRIWVYNGPMKRKAFKDQYCRKHFYQDIKLEAEPGKEHGVLRVKDRGQWVDLPVELLHFSGDEKANVAWDEQLERYTSKYNAKRALFDVRLQRELDQYEVSEERRSERAYADAAELMTPEETGMTSIAFDLYARERYGTLMATMSSGNATTDLVQRTFAMEGFGIYNCDRIIKRDVADVPVQVIASTGATFPWVRGYGVIPGRKAVITYWSTGTSDTQVLRMSENMEEILFVDLEGRLLRVQAGPGAARKGQVLRVQGEVLDPTAGLADL